MFFLIAISCKMYITLNQMRGFMTQREIQKEATSLLHSINNGVILLPKLKHFLEKLGAEKTLSDRKRKKLDRMAHYEKILK